jgi:hypothetical protein
MPNAILDALEIHLAELEAMPRTEDVERAIKRCREQIADAKGTPRSSLKERMSYQEGSIVFLKK